MIRVLTLAAIAALSTAIVAPSALAADPALTENSITVVLNGKSPAQVRSEVLTAAHTLCVRQTTYEAFRHHAIDACIRDAQRRAMADARVKMARMKAPEVLAAR